RCSPKCKLRPYRLERGHPRAAASARRRTASRAAFAASRRLHGWRGSEVACGAVVMKNRPRSDSRAASGLEQARSDDVLCDRDGAPQANSTIAEQLGDGIHIGSMWKSARNRREAIQVALKEYEGRPYLDARVFCMNDAGRMVPTKRGIAVGVKTLP